MILASGKDDYHGTDCLMEKESHSKFSLGVTGGIGSGKTSVCKFFSVLGVAVFSADIRAKEIMDHDHSIIKEINYLAGKDLYTSGSLDRAALAAIIFNNPEILGKVNSLVHPVVFDYFEKWKEEQASPYVVMEAAILFETGNANRLDRTVTVIAPEEERINRVILRNRLTREQVIGRIRNQMNDETRIKLSDYIIFNSENDMIIPAVLKIHEEILYNIKMRD
jgi:dephospho-CoA kinase